jgi:membrane protease YdiL (CAAX protease family)
MMASGEKRRQPDRRTPWRLLEPAGFVALALLYVWVVQPTRNDWLRVPFIIILVLIPLLSNVLHKDSLKNMGIRLDNLGISAREVGLVTLTAAAVILGVGYLARGFFHFPPEALQKLLLYPLWGLAQQYVMQAFVYRRLREGTGSVPVAGIATASLFAVIHWPNQVLVVMTLLGGMVWCRLFERQPNLFTLAISHGLIAVLLFYLCPEEWLRHLRIGPSYYR